MIMLLLKTRLNSLFKNGRKKWSVMKQTKPRYIITKSRRISGLLTNARKK